MADVDINVSQDNTEEFLQQFQNAILRGLEEIGLAAERYAKENLTANDSVVTGRLRNSVTHAVNNDEKAVYIGTNVEYGPYVELGTKRSKAKPYLEPAASGHGPEYRDMLESHLKS